MKKITKALFGILGLLNLGFLGCSKEDKNTLYIYNWTYYTPTTVKEKFEQKFNCKVVLEEYASNEEMYNKIKNGATGYDIVVPSQDFVSIMIQQDMFQPINQEKFTNKKFINPEVLQKAEYDSEMKYAVPYYFGAAGIAVNKTKVQEGTYARDWSIFSDKQFANHATMMDDMREVMGDALKFKGYSVNSMNENELTEIKNLINNEWKPNLVKFDAEAFGKSFAEGDFWLCQGYAEVVFGEVKEEDWANTIDFFIPECGGPSYLDSMCILKSAKHADLANEFINFMCDPENYAEFLDFFHFPCYVNTEAQKYTKTEPIYKASELKNCELKNDLGEGLFKYNEIWEEIRFGE